MHINYTVWHQGHYWNTINKHFYAYAFFRLKGPAPSYSALLTICCVQHGKHTKL